MPRDVTVGGSWLPETCNRADLAVLLDIGVRGVTELAATGVLVPAAQRGFYQTLPSIHAYIGKLRKQAAGRGGELSLNDERAKREKIGREREEIELAQLRGEVLTLDELSSAWPALCLKVRGILLAFPSKARGLVPHLTAHDQEKLRQMAVDGLNELADEVEAGIVGASPEELRPDGGERA